MTTDRSNEQETAAAGIKLASDAIHRIADGLDDEALALLNAADTGEVRWAAAYLLVCLRETVRGRVKGNPAKLRRVLHKSATGFEDDALITRVALMTQAGDLRG